MLLLTPPAFISGLFRIRVHRSGFGCQLFGIDVCGQATQNSSSVAPRSPPVASPRSLGARVQQYREPVLIEALIAQTTVDALDVGALVRLAGLDQAQSHASLVGPRYHRLATEAEAGHDLHT